MSVSFLTWDQQHFFKFGISYDGNNRNITVNFVAAIIIFFSKGDIKIVMLDTKKDVLIKAEAIFRVQVAWKRKSVFGAGNFHKT